MKGFGQPHTVRQHRRAGFTLVEMVLTVAILAILVSMAAPPLYNLIRQRDVQQESNRLNEIRQAVEAYMADTGELPPMASWATALGGYTNLSVEEMTNDTWNSPRAFITYTDTTRSIQGAQVAVNYVTILSSGPNRVAEASNGIAVQAINGVNQFAVNTNLGWWRNAASNADRISQYAALATTGDDLMVKYTDYPDKLKRYNLTVQRLDRISMALDAYARALYSNQVAVCAGLPRNASGLTGNALCDTPGGIEVTVNYYPRALAVNQPTDNANYLNTAIMVNNQGSETARRGEMVSLMRLLGLGDDFCCSALELAADGEPRPFFYFSNPRPRGSAGGCGTRPGATGPYLPPRLTSTNNDTATQPTCG